MYIKILFRQYSEEGVKLCEALKRKPLFNSILPDKIPFRFEILSSQYIYSSYNNNRDFSANINFVASSRSVAR